MVKLVDKAPTRLAEDCETCPCHRAMWAFMSKHMRAHMYTMHFGNGYTSCPMAGCHAPDLAHDWVERKLEEIWAAQETKLGTYVVVEGAQMLSPDSWTILINDFNNAKAGLTAILVLKNCYWKQLPWFFAILANGCEEVARQGAAKLIDMFEEDPTEAAHSPIIWALMKPSSDFRQEPQRFNHGAARRSLSTSFRKRLGVWKMMPVVGTTIEEKHARVSAMAKMGRIGPVRVFLPIDLPRLARKL